MWIFKLLVVLAFSNACVIVRGHNTNTWAMQVNLDTDGVKEIAEKYGFLYKLKICADCYLSENKSLPKISSQPTQIQEDGLSAEPLDILFSQQVRRKRVLYDSQLSSVLLNDPGWREQRWYLNSPDGKGMNIDKVWQQGVTGKGIVVAVVDDGLQQFHPDLKDNYDPTASLDLVDWDYTPAPDPVGPFAGHGNRCGGIIAASANNSQCGIGVAFNAKLGGIRVFGDDDPTDSMEALAFQYQQQYIDIYSCSWGPADTGWTMEGPEQLARDQMEKGTKIGRQGKGSIFVFAAGNGGREFDNCAYNGYANSVFTITITGVSRNGSIPGYAERCSAIMASTYSQDNVATGNDSFITSDLNDTCTSTFALTSAATAIASGIIALALEVNTNLTWRDLQYLIAYSSNYDVPRSDDWVKNSAGLWVSSYFGFGLMDAATMVKYSRSWRTVPRQIKCEIPQPKKNRRISSRHTELNLAVSEDDCGGESNIKYLEHVLVIIHARFARRGYLEGYVTSPSGTVSQILPYRPYDVIATDFNNWPILSLHFWGENPQGTWKLRLRSHFPNKKFSGTLYNWTLVLYGTASDPLDRNPHVSRSLIRKSQTEVATDSAGTAKPSGSRREGLTGVEITVIGAVASLVILVILCAAVVLYKIGAFPCGKKSSTTRASNEIRLLKYNAIEV